MPPAWAIRPFASQDAAALDALRAAAFAPVFASFRALLGPAIAPIALANAETEQQALLQSLCAGEADAHIFVAHGPDGPLGFVAVRLDRVGAVGEIVLDAVAPAEAGRGVGTALIAHALEFMRGQGMRAAVVGVGGDESHAPARRAYEKAGFGPGLPSIHLYRTL